MTIAAQAPTAVKRSYVDRVADRAADVQVVRLLLSLLALPFWLLGLLVGVLWLAIRWCYAAAIVGFGDVKRRSRNVSATDAAS